MGNFTFWGFYFFKKKYTKRPENFDYKIDGWTFLTLVKVEYVIWLKYQPPFQTMTFFCWFGHLLHLWVFFFCKVKISQELVCELKEKSLKINVSLPQVYRIQLHTFEIKWRRKHSRYFILFPPNFSHIYQIFRHDLSS